MKHPKAVPVLLPPDPAVSPSLLFWVSFLLCEMGRMVPSMGTLWKCPEATCGKLSGTQKKPASAVPLEGRGGELSFCHYAVSPPRLASLSCHHRHVPRLTGALSLGCLSWPKAFVEPLWGTEAPESTHDKHMLVFAFLYPQPACL